MLDIADAAKDSGACEIKLEDGTKLFGFTSNQLSAFAESINNEGRRIIVQMRDQIERLKIEARKTSKTPINDPMIDL
jgi:hypothetical protein